MLRLMHHEWRKLFSQKLTIGLLVCLIGLNGILLNHAAGQPIHDYLDIDRMDLARAYDHYEGQTPEEIEAELRQWLSDYQALYYIDDQGNFHTPTQAQIDAMLVFTEDIRLDSGIRSLMLEQVTALTGYGAYLDSVQDSAESLGLSILFSDPNSFAHRNLEKTAEKYLPLYQVALTAGDSSGITLALESHTTTVFLLAAVVLLVFSLIREEREQGLMLLLKPTARGRSALILAKLAVLFLSLGMLMLLFYGGNLALTGNLFGLGSLSRSIQSLQGYLTSAWQISLGEYLVAFFLGKWLVLSAVGLVFALVCLLAQNRVQASVIAAGITVVELCLYVGIPCNSWLAPLRQLNLAAAMDTTAYFSDYFNMNFFGWPVDAAWATAAFCNAIGICCLFQIHRRWCREENLETVRARAGMARSKIPSTSLTLHEGYKLLVTGRGAVLLVLLIALQWVCYGDVNAYELESEQWYQSYIAQLLGDVTAEKEAFLQEEEEHFAQVSRQQMEILEQAQRGELDSTYASYLVSSLAIPQAQQGGFLRVKSQWAYLQTQQALGKTVQFLSTTGYDHLLNDRRADVLDASKLGFVMAVCLSAYFTMEADSGMNQLIGPSPAGKRRVFRRKLIVTFGFLLAVWAVCFLPRSLASLAIYPMEHADFAAASLAAFSPASAGCSILEYWLLLNLARVAGMLVTALVLALLCQKIRRPIPALVICLGILEVPVFLWLLGIVEEAAFLPMLTGHWMLGR